MTNHCHAKNVHGGRLLIFMGCISRCQSAAGGLSRGAGDIARRFPIDDLLHAPAPTARAEVAASRELALLDPAIDGHRCHGEPLRDLCNRQVGDGDVSHFALHSMKETEPNRVWPHLSGDLAYSIRKRILEANTL